MSQNCILATTKTKRA